jgi:hypothetical protein
MQQFRSCKDGEIRYDRTMANISSEVAQSRIQAFRDRFGEAHFWFACHGAFPLALTPDLLYRIWANFQQDIFGQSLSVPWMAVADLLLSSLCDEVGHELYEMPLEIRNNLLGELQECDRFSDERVLDLSYFLAAYVKQQLDSYDIDTRDFARAQKWLALSYIEPNEAAYEIASYLASLKLEDKSEWVYMASLLENFQEPLARFQPLISYPKIMKQLSRGNIEASIAELRVANIDIAQVSIRINDVILPIPLELRQRKKEPQNSQLRSPKNLPQILNAFNPVEPLKAGDRAQEVIAQMFNAFDPVEPLKAGDRAYVDCTSVRGDEDIISYLGSRITRSNQPTCHLYTGHRGSGTSTELRRLKEHLEKRDFFVVYFEADNEDIDMQDVEYVDILLACTRRLLKDLGMANAEPIRSWLSNRALELKDLRLTEAKLDSSEVVLSVFSKLTASIRAEPYQRAKIRSQINPHTVSLLNALNELIENATNRLPNGKKKLALIVDNLGRIPLIVSDYGRSNHEEIFIDRSEQLRQLSCHVVYTVPITLLYSKWANDVQMIYGETPILPAVMLRDMSGYIIDEGIEKLEEILRRRVQLILPDADINKTVFESEPVLKRLCLSSGGNIRELLQMAQETLILTADLPITERTVNRAISKLRDTYQRTIEESEWSLLAQVHCTGSILNGNEYRSLLHRRCILEYRSANLNGEITTFYRVHPLVELLSRLQDELNKLNP